MITAFTRLCADSSQASPSLRKIEWITFSTERVLRKSVSGDRSVVLPLGHLAQHVELTRRQVVQRRLLGVSPGGDERLDDLRVDHRAAARDGTDRGDELVDILDPLLEQVRAALASVLERARAYPGSVYWLRTTTPSPGELARSSRAAWMPSSSPPAACGYP